MNDWQLKLYKDNLRIEEKREPKLLDRLTTLAFEKKALDEKTKDATNDYNVCIENIYDAKERIKELEND